MERRVFGEKTENNNKNVLTRSTPYTYPQKTLRPIRLSVECREMFPFCVVVEEEEKCSTLFEFAMPTCLFDMLQERVTR